MSYTKKTWSTGDTITAEALNNLESGASANASAIAEIEKELPSYVGADVPRKAAETITPGTANQTIAANQYLTGAQTIEGDGNLSAGNIKKGVSIFGVSGTLEMGTDTSDATATAGDILYGETAYVNGEKVTGTIKSKAASTITPGTSDQTIAANQYLTGAQTIKGDSNLVAANIKKGASIFGVTGTLEAGSTETDKTGTGAYIWEKRDEKIWWVESKSGSTSSKPSGYGTTEYRSRTITDDGYYSLSNSEISLDVYYLPTGATNGKTKTILYKPYSAFGASYYVCTLSDEKGKTGKKGDTILGYISADSESAYPNSGLQDDVFYTLINTPDVDVTAAKMLDGTVACGQSGKVIGTISKKASATITPGTADQTISSGQYLSGAQTIKGDENLVAENIKSGVSIFGVTGTLETGGTGTDTSDATASASDILSGKTAYVKGTKVTGTISKKAAATITPGTADQTIAAGQYLSGAQTIEGDGNLSAGNIKKGVSIFGVSGTLEMGTDTSDATATAGDILYGETAYVNGEKVTGTIQSIGARTITPSVNDKEIQAGYYLKGNQTIKGDANLLADNIKKGVSIFGVAGTYAGSGGSGSGNNNCEAYVITSANAAVNFKNSSGTIKVYGYGTVTSQSSWGGGSTSLLAFHGDHYYKSVSYGSPSSTALSLSINSDGTIGGLPSMDACELLVVRGV